MADIGEGKFRYEISGFNWGNLPEGWYYKEAVSVAVDSTDQVYVFSRGNHPVIVFDTAGNVLRSWGEGQFTNPHGITVASDDTVWCVDSGDHSIRRYSSEGRLITTLNERHVSSAPMCGKPFCKPTRVAIDPRNDEILVADGYGNACVHRFSADGMRLIGSFGRPGTDSGAFNVVHDIAVDEEGLIYIADRENHRVQVFSPQGCLVGKWGNLSKSAAVHLSGDEVFVGEYYCGSRLISGVVRDLGPRISVLDRQGEVLARLGRESYGDDPGRFYAPHCLATDSVGDLYVAEVSYSEFGYEIEPPRELRSLQKLVRTSPIH